MRATLKWVPATSNWFLEPRHFKRFFTRLLAYPSIFFLSKFQELVPSRRDRFHGSATYENLPNDGRMEAEHLDVDKCRNLQNGCF